MFRLLPFLILAACDPSAVVALAGGVSPQAPSPVDADRFVTDLGAALHDWYTTHGADVAAAGGEPLVDALLAVDVGQVDEVRDPSDTPFGDDLSTTAVFRHPDVVFPGSDRAWFGAYRLSDGSNLYVADFE